MSGKEFKVGFAPCQWCERWGLLCGVSNVTLVGVNDISYTGGALVKFTDHGEDREAVLFPRDVAEVIGYNRWRTQAEFDKSANLIVTNFEV